MRILSGYKKILPAVVFIYLSIQNNSLCFSQGVLNTENQNEKVFLVRTKQFIEFLDRFNYKTNFNGEKIDSVFKSKFPRDKMISSLFNLKDTRLDPSDKSYSTTYIKQKAEFINEVIHKNLMIFRYSDNIIAEAKSRVLLNGTPKTISIFLTQEIIGKDMVKWVINDVKGDIFNFLKSDTAFVRFIPPSSNETDFMNLKRALEDTKYLQYYSSKNYEPDYLTVFYYMLNTGLVKFDYVEDVTYHIIDIPGWCIKVKDFNRNEMNSGWLIYDISKNSSDKNTFLKSLCK
jgi:hypothetical protein